MAQIMTALRKADAAGNTADAKRLADAYRALRDEQEPAQAGTWRDAPVVGASNDAQRPKWMDAPVVEQGADPKLHGLTANAGVGTQQLIAELAGLPVDAATGAINGVSGLINGAFGTSIPAIQNPIGGSDSIYQAMSPLHSKVAEPQTAGERLARRVGHDVAAAALPGAGIAAAAGKAVLPAVVGNAVSGAGAGLAGGLTQEVTDNPVANMAATMVGGALAPAAVNGAVKGAGRLVSPNGGADTERLAMARTLDQQGVQTTAGQKVGNDTLRRMEASTGAGKARLGAQDEQFTQAVLRTLGADAKRATPEVMAKTYRAIGNEFDDILGSVSLAPGQDAVTRAKSAVQAYRDLAPASEAAPLIATVGKRISEAAQKGQTIPGTTAKAWRSQLSRALRSNSEATRTAAGELLEALDDTTSQALTVAGRADDVERLATARQRYRDFLAVERAVSGAGEDAAFGIISPARLRAAISGQGARAYSQGKRGAVGDLARAGAAVLGKPSTSGTAENLNTNVRAGLGIAGTAASSMAGAGILSPAFGIAAAAAPSVINRLALSPPAQDYLANQLLSLPNALSGLNAGRYAPVFGAGNNALLDYK